MSEHHPHDKHDHEGDDHDGDHELAAPRTTMARMAITMATRITTTRTPARA
jgi:hypothetical protein